MDFLKSNFASSQIKVIKDTPKKSSPKKRSERICLAQFALQASHFSPSIPLLAGKAKIIHCGDAKRSLRQVYDIKYSVRCFVTQANTMHRGKNSRVKTRFAIFERNTQQAQRSLCIHFCNWRTYQALASQLPKLNQNPEVSLSSQHKAIIAVWDITRIWRWRRRHIWWTSPSIIKASTSIIKAPSAVIETPSPVIETSSSRWTRWTAPSWGGLSTSIIAVFLCNQITTKHPTLQGFMSSTVCFSSRFCWEAFLNIANLPLK